MNARELFLMAAFEKLALFDEGNRAAVSKLIQHKLWDKEGPINVEYQKDKVLKELQRVGSHKAVSSQQKLDRQKAIRNAVLYLQNIKNTQEDFKKIKKINHRIAEAQVLKYPRYESDLKDERGKVEHRMQDTTRKYQDKQNRLQRGGQMNPKQSKQWRTDAFNEKVKKSVSEVVDKHKADKHKSQDPPKIEPTKTTPAISLHGVGVPLLGTLAAAGLGYGAYRLYKHLKKKNKKKNRRRK